MRDFYLCHCQMLFGFVGRLMAQGGEVGLACLHTVGSDPSSTTTRRRPCKQPSLHSWDFKSTQDSRKMHFDMGVTCSQHFGRRTPAVAATLCRPHAQGPDQPIANRHLSSTRISVIWRRILLLPKINVHCVSTIMQQ
jgi:hypothetical protein